MKRFPVTKMLVRVVTIARNVTTSRVQSEGKENRSMSNSFSKTFKTIPLFALLLPILLLSKPAISSHLGKNSVMQQSNTSVIPASNLIKPATACGSGGVRYGTFDYTYSGYAKFYYSVEYEINPKNCNQVIINSVYLQTEQYVNTTPINWLDTKYAGGAWLVYDLFSYNNEGYVESLNVTYTKGYDVVITLEDDDLTYFQNFNLGVLN